MKNKTIGVVGNAWVGKTALIKRFISGKSEHSNETSIDLISFTVHNQKYGLNLVEMKRLEGEDPINSDAFIILYTPQVKKFSSRRLKTS